MSESAIYGIEMVIVLPLSLKESVDPSPSVAVGKYNFAVREYNVAVRMYARPQQLFHAVAEESGTPQHFYK